MWLKRKDAALEAGSPTAEVIAFPSSVIPARPMTENVQRTYEEMAKDLGFMPEELVRAQLLAFMHENQFTVYDYAEVSAYLTKKKELEKEKTWCWRPLRPKDELKFSWGDGQDGFYVDSRCRPYERLVPHHALEKVAKIEKRFGDQMKFFVSDYPAPKPDPFIAVRAWQQGSVGFQKSLIVFDVWDEPGFGLK